MDPTLDLYALNRVQHQEGDTTGSSEAKPYGHSLFTYHSFSWKNSQPAEVNQVPPTSSESQAYTYSSDSLKMWLVDFRAQQNFH